MTFGDWLRTVWSNLNRMRGRVVLTAFGVVIGTTAVMVLVSLGAGLQRSAMGSLGGISNLKRINVTGASSEYQVEMAAPSGKEAGTGSRNRPKLLTEAALAEIRALPGVEAVIPLEQFSGGGLQFRNAYGYAEILGVTPEALAQLDLTVETGSADLARGQMVVGSQVKNNFWDGQRDRAMNIETLLGEIVSIEGMRFSNDAPEPSTRTWRYNVVGVLASSGQSDNQIFILQREVQSMNEWLAGRRIDRTREGYERVIVQAADSDEVEAIQQSVRDMGFTAYSDLDAVRQLNTFFAVLQAVLGSIGAIALLVAALGIVNTLSMAILERTREIGLMKALGARNHDVMLVFLGEAACIGLLGGVLGVVIGWGISSAANVVIGSLLSQSNGAASGIFGTGSTDFVYTPFWLPPFAIVFATLIGLLSGVYPALRAATLDPLRALKYE